MPETAAAVADAPAPTTPETTAPVASVSPAPEAAAPAAATASAPEAKPEKSAPKVVQPFVLKAPEGKVLKDGYLEGRAQSAQSLGLTVEQAQKQLDAELAAHDAQVAAWQGELKTKYGANVDASRLAARNAVAALWGPEFQAEVEASGLINHPLFFEGLAKFGARLSESGSLPTGGTPPKAVPPTSDAEIIFGKKQGA